MHMSLRHRQHSALQSHGVHTSCLLFSLKGESVLAILVDQFLTMTCVLLLTGQLLIANIQSPTPSLITLNGGGFFTNLPQGLMAQVSCPITG